MQTAGARALREDDKEMSREAVLLQWERKLEAEERRDGGPVESTDELVEPVPLRPVEDATRPGSRRFERRPAPAAEPVEAASVATAPAERRTITITGHPTPARRRRAVVDAQLAQPDRIALWAFLLGLFLVAVAAGTAHA